MSDALIVFAKVPAAGHVKTRLTPELSDQEAADLYEAFLLDTLDACAPLDADVRLYLAPSPPKRGVSFVPEGVAVFEQRGEGLGERMSRAFVDAFAGGYARACIVGTDHPTLPTSFIEYAFLSLSQPRSVSIGPAEDGGYYLLAMNDFMPEVFRGMVYSRPAVFKETLQRIALAGAHAIVLPQWYDVDTPDQLRRLRAELRGNVDLAPRTSKQIEKLARRYFWLDN